VLKVAAVIVLVGAGVWAWHANKVGARPAMEMTVRATPETTPFPVTLAAVGHGPIAGTVTYTGTIAPYNEEDIFARVTGRILEMPVYPGDAVRAGQLVARLDDIELASRVSESQAMAATAQAGRAQMESDLLAAQHGIVQMEREVTMVEAELEYARAVAGRSEQLVTRGVIARQEFENDRSMALSLEAKREAARAKLEQARAMEAAARRKVEAAGAMVAQSEAALRTAGIVRDYTRIVAPSTGYVVKRLVAPGVLVQPGMPILKIAQIDRVRLQANVGERDVQSIRVGSPVAVTLAGNGGAAFTTRVTAVFPFVEQGSRTATVEAVVDNAGRRLLPGQYVAMQFTTGGRPDALTVPRGAVARLGSRATIWVVEDGRARPRVVTTGLESPERIEIVDGVAAGENIVARGHEALYAGARVAAAGATAGAPHAGSHGAPAAGDAAGPATPGAGSHGAPAPDAAHGAAPKENAHGSH
jgi:multidrug efflux pump subunit AcrA (membrane-fusion protein)